MTRLAARAILGAVIAVVAWVAAAQAPSRLVPEVNPGYRPGTTGTEAGLWMVMDNAEAEIRSSPHRIADPALEEYLRDILCRLAPDHCQDVRVYVIRAPYFNASMAPNGTMQVWTGLLLRVRNEAQLTAVLGHELGHYLRRHSLKNFQAAKTRMNVITFLTLGLGAGMAAGGIGAGAAETGSTIGELAAIASLFAFNREQEREADRYGIELMADADYDVREAPKVWRTLIAEERAATYQRGASWFFATHPQPESREALLEADAAALAAGGSGGARNEAEFQQHVGPLLPDLLADEMKLNQFGRSEFVLNTLLHDGVAPGRVRFHLGELFRTRNQDGDLARARGHYEDALAAADPPPEAHRGLGLVHLKQREFAHARPHFERYLALVPQAADREMIEYYLTLGGDSP